MSDFSFIRILEVGIGGALGCLLRFVLVYLVQYFVDNKKDIDKADQNIDSRRCETTLMQSRAKCIAHSTYRFFKIDKLKGSASDVLAFPHHTLLVNVLGCFIMGLLSVILVHPSPLASTALDAFFLIGFCGGLTTFSSFMLDTVNHFRVRQYFYVIGYLVITVGFCLIADFIGRVLAHHWFV